jgi:nucleoside-diphosphate-sugar epimerase
LKLSKVLILGASGFIGGTLYKELSRFYNTFGTYCHQVKTYSNNKQFIRFNVEEDDAFEMLNTFQPDLIISALRGPFNSLITAHAHMSEYVLHNPCKLVFISSTNVFDDYSKYPS